MARAKVKRRTNVVERNIRLTSEIYKRWSRAGPGKIAAGAFSLPVRREPGNSVGFEALIRLTQLAQHRLGDAADQVRFGRGGG